MYNSEFNIEYNSNDILIISNNSSGEFWVICLDDFRPKIVKINTWVNGLDNEEIEIAIEKVLHNGGYDIEYELELYRNSDLYRNLKDYESGLK